MPSFMTTDYHRNRPRRNILSEGTTRNVGGIGVHPKMGAHLTGSIVSRALHSIQGSCI